MSSEIRKGWFDKLRFKTQLTLVFVVGILLLASVTSLVVSKISSGIIEEHQVLQGMQVTESLARQSEVALLYQSEESARDIGRNAVNFPGVKGIIIETDKSDLLFNIGITSFYLPDQAVATEKTDELSLVAESENFWKFTSPVYTSNGESNPGINETADEKVLLGYITVIAGKDTLRLMQQSTLRNNMLVSFAGAMILLFVLLYFSRRLTSPIERLSAAMRRARDGKRKSIRARVYGPVDITEMQESFNSMMQVLEDRQGDLERAMNSALESARVKGEFAANVTHELRTPMNAVLGMLDLLLTMGLSFKQREYVETAKSSGESLLHLIDEILDFSEGDAGKISLSNHDYLLNESLDDIVGLLSSTALKKQINFGYIVDGDVPQALCADSVRIRQVLINLAGNGIKFTEKGEVSIHVSVDRDTVDNSTPKGHIQLKFVVRDTGIGVSLEDQARVFEAFTQVDSSTTKEYQGTGLGLAISTQLVEMMGGDIFVNSEVGVGSEFGFTLPVQTAEPVEPAESYEELEGLNALFVSDSEILNLVARQGLEALGLRVQLASGGTEALALIRECNKTDPFDVMFVDQEINDIKINDFIGFIKQENNFDKQLTVMLSNPWAVESRVRDLMLPRLNKPLRSNSFTDLLVKYFVNDQIKASPEYKKLMEPEARSCKVLIVDDNRANQQVAVAMLEKLHCKTTVAENGQKALEAVSRDEFDLVLMDCNMPVMSGYDATEKIRELEGDKVGTLPIIAMTANNSEAEEEHCRDVGMSDFLSKPLSLNCLSEKLDKWAGGPFERGRQSVELKGEEGVDSDSSVRQSEAAYRSLSYDVKAVESLREAVGEVVSSMISAFIEDTPIYLEKLKAAAAENNVDQIREMAHTIKGSAANFGAYDLVRLSKSLEGQATRESLVDVDEQVDSIFSAFDILKEDLDQENSKDNRAACGNPPVNKAQQNPGGR